MVWEENLDTQEKNESRGQGWRASFMNNTTIKQSKAETKCATRLGITAMMAQSDICSLPSSVWRRSYMAETIGIRGIHFI
jgi:hypothetical protein